MEDKNNVNTWSKGLSTDTSKQNQPKDSYTFALNAVNISSKGDVLSISNEESNVKNFKLPKGFTPICDIYKKNGEIIVLLVSNDNVSEIGIIKNNKQYVTIINDADSNANDKLNFSKHSLITAVYRLRLGCEDVIYFFDKVNKPRYFNLNKPELFKNKEGKTSARLFNLFRNYERIPTFSKVNVNDAGGSIKPGSYNISVQYLDKGLNPTEWIASSKVIYIYNSSLNNEYMDISGSINGSEDYQRFSNTNKSIDIEISNLDTSFDYYRLAIIGANSGNGQVNDIVYTDIISTNKTSFTYTGTNAVTIGTEEEVKAFNAIIERVGYADVKDNILVLGDIQGKQMNYCRLQKYASKIKSDCIIKNISLNDVNDPYNPKNPTHEFGDMITGGIGYMPGEVYSFGIVYVFADGSMSPVFHIPGKSKSTLNTKFSKENNVYPMSVDNQSNNNVYLDTNSCDDSNYWGQDSEGVNLKGQYVRHHRFPMRSQIDTPLVEVHENSGTVMKEYYQLEINATGVLELPCTQEMVDDEENPCEKIKNVSSFIVRVTYTVEDVPAEFDFVVDPNFYIGGDGTFVQEYRSNMYTTDDIKLVSITESTDGINFVEPSKLTYTDSVETTKQKSETKNYKGNLLGIKFSNIDLPSLEDTNGEEIIGYYIVRNERTQAEKTIIDTCVLGPTIENDKYISHGLLLPEFDLNTGQTIWGAVKSKHNKKALSVIHPEHKFNKKEIFDFTEIQIEGEFNVVDRLKSNIIYNDVLEGSSYDGSIHKKGNDDGDFKDGWCLDVIVRDNILTYQQKFRGLKPVHPTEVIKTDEIEDKFYLDALGSKDVDKNRKSVYNLSADNKIGMLYMREEQNFLVDKLYYAVMKKQNEDPYSNYRILPYYLESLKIERFTRKSDNTTSIFSGDSYISPMRYVSTVFYDNRVAQRAGKTSAWKKIAGAVLVVVGVVLAIWTGGSSLAVAGIGAGLVVAGAGATILASGIKWDNVLKAYQDEYAKGLRETALDHWVQRTFGKNNNKYQGGHGPSDDSIQYIADCATDLWFDTTINTALRNRINNDTAPSFVPSPGKIETGNNVKREVKEYFKLYWLKSYPSRYPISKLEFHISQKLLYFDAEKVDAKTYWGLPLGELYDINPDYKRFNKQKVYFHLPVEYECCSDCSETFPHRLHYSEQSFQEELTDNFRVFLPNNYIDIPGETGKITDLFVYNNNFYVHTEEALWILPNNHQERVTDQIVSFIGTGDFFSVPPRKLLDSRTGNSAGTRHNRSRMVTPDGVFFVSESERNIYQINTQGVKSILNSNINWFNENIPLLTDKMYYDAKGEMYPFDNNTISELGSGFTTAYDNEKKRLLFTKKDRKLNKDFIETDDYLITSDNKDYYIFRNFSKIVEDMINANWNYVGIYMSELLFSKSVYKTVKETRYKLNADFEFEAHQVEIKTTTEIYERKKGEVFSKEDIFIADNSWTISYSFLNNNWVSYHSYLPNKFFSNQNKVYSWINNNDEDNPIWLHNVKGKYGEFYGKQHPFILEFISNINPMTPMITNSLYLRLDTEKFDFDNEQYYSVDNVFFTSGIFFNSKQSSGEITFEVKDKDNSDYFDNILNNETSSSIIANKTEHVWRINELRDYRIDYNTPIFSSKLEDRQDNYFIDKVLNDSSIDHNKDWTQLESFRDNYFGARLLFDNFANTKLTVHVTTEDEGLSYR